MAKYGAGCSVWLDLVDASQFFNEAGLELAVGTADTSTFQPGVSPAWKAFIEGIAESKATVKGFYDQVNDAALFGEIRNGGSVLTYGPQGMVAVGDPARLVSVHATTVAESSPIGGAVLANVAYQGEGVVGFGWCLQPLAAGAQTPSPVTGADRDDLAATTAGWMAHLHVTAVTGGSWVVKLQDAATTDWADVAGGAFTAATGPAAQRLVSAAGATLRRHVRFVATRTGGVAGDSITFGLAYARNR